jgi:glycine/D-amino acid oxidase-like deaminating enzyme
LWYSVAVRSIEQACYWLATRSHTPAPALEGDRLADVAIIGAGFTGLWTAMFLKQLSPATEIVLLEQGVAGYGGSGRNGGILSETIDHSHQLAIAHFGEAEAAKLARIGSQNIDEMERFFAERAIDCNFERTGRLFVALTPAQLEDARRSVETAGRLGTANYRLLSADEIRAELDSPLYLGGVFAPGGGILNPIKLVDGLKREATGAGIQFFERTPVLGFSVSGARLIVKTALGNVSTRKVILATNAYTHQLFPKLLRRFIPLYDYILVSEPLSGEQLAAIGWRNRQGVTDGRTFFNYYRLTRDNRVLWGTSEAVYYRGNRVDESCDHSERHYRTLRESFARHFPQIADLKFEYAWGGPIASTTRLTPFFGSLANGKILYGLGYTGHGIGSTRVAGKILAHMALERPSELLELSMVRRKPFPYPPEPVRSWAVNAVTRSLRRVDAGKKPSMLLRILDALGIGFSS